MSSLLPGYEYDIFISYRHNDNRSGWVTEFVKSLQEELVSTIKEPLSVYFDTNPHDGLLENHNVDKSLEGKLKCLIFIPIVSQTYCDTKNFAWQHEFCAFNKTSKEDGFGRDIKLASGNVASRILPIKIHDLDTEDKALFENELDGALRAIEFIYKEPGVNRPLKSPDSKQDNQNKTDYRNQVNKVANAIKEIITSLKNPVTLTTPTATIIRPVTKSKPRKVAWLAVPFLLLLGIAWFFLYPRLRSSTKEVEALDKSIAVLPFLNMSNDPEQEYFSDGLSEELLTLLSKIPELKVIGRTSSFSFKGKNEDLRIIGERLGVAHLLDGSVQREGNKIRVTAQLKRAADGSHLWTEKYERDVKGIFALQDEIANAVVAQLKLKLLPRTSNGDLASNNPEVYSLILQGNYYVERRDKESVDKALDFYLKALAKDSSSARTWAGVAKCYSQQLGWGWIDRNEGMRKASKAVAKSLSLDDTRADGRFMSGMVKLWDFDWDGAEAEFKQALNLEPGNAEILRIIGFLYRTTGHFEQSLSETEKAITLDPVQAVAYLFRGQTLYYSSRFDEAIASFNKALELNPQLPRTHVLLGEIYLRQGKPEMAIAEMQEEKEDAFKAAGMFVAYYLTSKQKHLADYALISYIAKYENLWPYKIARMYAFRGEKDKAFEWLEKAYAKKDSRLIWIKNDPFLKSLEGDPRHTAFLKKMNLL